MLTQSTDGVWGVVLSEVPVTEWPYWFQQAALKNGTLDPSVTLVSNPNTKRKG